MKRNVGKLVGMGLCMLLLAGCGQAEASSMSEAESQSEAALTEAEQDTEKLNSNRETESEAQSTAEPEAPTPSAPNVSVQENRVIIDEIIYDEVLNPIGAVLSRQVIRYSEINPERELYKVNITWPEIDVSFEGADRINRVLLEYVDSRIAYMEQNVGELEEDYEQQGYSFGSSFDGFAYRDDHYISFIQSEYDYEGGAHGMPYREPFTFHLQTGERLVLSDIIGNSEEEQKEIVTRYFAEMINAAPEKYWENAMDIVRQKTDLGENFVLTREGLLFYLLPYDIAPYVAGFPEVTIPYEEFDMKIVLGEQR